MVIGIFDINKRLTKEDTKILEVLKNKKSIIVLNKNDLDKNIEKEILASYNIPIIEISAVNGKGLNELFDKMYEMFKLDDMSIDGEVIISNERHKNHIRNARKNVLIARKTVEDGLPLDMISSNIKEILEELGMITGDSVTEDIINEIFSKFCLGK